MDNSVALRQSLHRIFSEILNQGVQITVMLKSGIIASYKKFTSEYTESLILFVDSDCSPEKMSSWFDNFEKKENEKRKKHGEEPNFQIPVQYRKKIFFMIQEMESWILKDFSSIEKWAKKNDYKRLREKEDMSQHTLVKARNIECIKKPSEKLNSLFKIYFEKNNGEKVSYGKLKTAPSLLDCIDVPVLLSKDLELQRFAASINSTEAKQSV